jgi:hypothetical protein
METMNEEVVIDGNNVLIFDHENLDPNGDPTVIEMTLEEYQHMLDEV